jgi:mono/diheme cytochrome c family protein
MRIMLVLLVLAGCVQPERQTTGALDFAENCAACHGPTGRGDGALAADLARRPADLTGLSRRNGGVFPTTRVMAQIWGYAGQKGAGVMPNFAAMLDGEMVLYDGGDGIDSPTPIRLVELAEYLKTLQE